MHLALGGHVTSLGLCLSLCIWMTASGERTPHSGSKQKKTVRGAVWLSFQSSPSRTLRWNSQGGTFSPCVLFVPTSSMYMFMGLAVICMHLLGNKIKRFIFCIFYTTVLRSERCKKLLYWAQLSFFPSSCMAYFFLAECVWRPFWKPNKFYN